MKESRVEEIESIRDLSGRLSGEWKSFVLNTHDPVPDTRVTVKFWVRGFQECQASEPVFWYLPAESFYH